MFAIACRTLMYAIMFIYNIVIVFHYDFNHFHMDILKKAYKPLYTYVILQNLYIHTKICSVLWWS